MMRRQVLNSGWRRGLVALVVGIGLLASGMMQSKEAHACGGFFCSQQDPVDQAGERILFSVEGTLVTAMIQILYQGTAADFSWVLPLPSTPEVSVGTDLVFSVLHQNTDPRFELEWLEGDGCNLNDFCGCMFEDAATGGGNELPPNTDPGVEVLESGSVGPFNYEILGAISGDALFTWLNENGYDQPAAAQVEIDHYVDMDFVFVALKLQKDKDSGDIQPLIVKYDAPNLACVPLRLTRIAAVADMPIYTWILSGTRAIPINYFHVVLNDKAFDWLRCATPSPDSQNCFGWWWGGGPECQESYMSLLTSAIDGANGHGFVTEYAGSSDLLEDKFYTDEMFDLETLRNQTNPGIFMQQMMSQGFPATGVVRELIREFIPKPDDAVLPEECKGDSNFYRIWNIENCLPYMPDDWSFDAEAMTDALSARIVEPLMDAQELVGKHGYMTRLVTTVSPDDMTKDPIFSFNADLEDVPLVRTAQAVANCGDEASSVTLIFNDGSTLEVPGQFEECGGFVPDDPLVFADQEPIAEIQVLEESGPPVSIDPDEVEDMDKQLDKRVANPDHAGIPTTPVEEPAPVGPSPSSGGCTASAGSSCPLCSPPVLLLLVLFCCWPFLRQRVFRG